VIALCKLDDIPSGRSLGVLPDARGRDQILIVRKEGEVFGYRNSCPHYDRARLGWKKNEFLNGDRTMIMCAAHGALFRINFSHVNKQLPFVRCNLYGVFTVQKTRVINARAVN